VELLERDFTRNKGRGSYSLSVGDAGVGNRGYCKVAPPHLGGRRLMLATYATNKPKFSPFAPW